MWIKTSVAALGIVGALVAATPAPTLTQGVHVGPGGAQVGVSAITEAIMATLTSAAVAVGRSPFAEMMAA